MLRTTNYAENTRTWQSTPPTTAGFYLYKHPDLPSWCESFFEVVDKLLPTDNPFNFKLGKVTLEAAQDYTGKWCKLSDAEGLELKRLKEKP